MPNTVKATKPSPKPERQNPEAQWTVLVYFAGDNNLTAEMVWGLQELQKASAVLKLKNGRRRVNVVAHFDPGAVRARNYEVVSARKTKPKTADESNGFPEDGRLNEDETSVMTAGFVDSILAGARETLGLTEAGRMLGEPGRALAAFVASQIQSLPRAGQYFVILSGHGSGAEGDFLTDADPNTSLSIPELGHILREAIRLYASKDGKPDRIGILGMDTCLMSNAEVCYEIQDSVDYLLASEGFVQDAGWPYFRVMESLLSDDSKEIDPEPKTVAKRMARLYSKFYRDYEIAGVSTDIAVCDLRAFEDTKEDATDDTKEKNLIPSIRRFANALIPELEAAHARRLMDSFGGKVGHAEEVRQALARKIGRLLKDRNLPDLEELFLDDKKQLGQAIQEIESRQNGFTASQSRALEELVASKKKCYKADRRVQDALNHNVTEPENLWEALAFVRVKREFDPAVLEALARIERRDRDDSPEAADERADAKKARALLHKYHQIQGLLDLKKLEPKFENSEGNSRNVDLMVAARWEAQPFKGSVYADLYDLCSCLKRRGAPAAALDDVMNAFSQKSHPAVVFSSTTGAQFQHAHGLSVYFPVNVNQYTHKYQNLQFARDTGWWRLVRAYLEATRKPRRGEWEHLLDVESPLLRYHQLEVDPLDSQGIEARIVGVAEAGDPSSVADRWKTGREGTEKNIREGTEKNIREGTEKNIREGTEKNIRGQVVTAVFGNPPDGFYRRDA